MSSWPERMAAALALAGTALVASAQAPYAGIGRPATAAEVRAWDIDVRPDFLGLPRGSGSVAQGQVIWEAKCASCHGIFGEANNVFTPLVGGTTPQDVATGRVARLTDNGFPGRTTLMKAAHLSSLWDYIHRAMPWNEPKSLTPDEVYAVTAYMLNLGGILPDDFVLSDRTIGQAQARMPNRKGFTTDHGLWPGRSLGNGSRPDVRAQACMTNCGSAPRVASDLPDFARNQHGNLAEQQRLAGPQRGADTARPAQADAAGTAAAAIAAARVPLQRAVLAAGEASPLGLAQRHGCTTCHGVDNRIVGPSFREVATRYAGAADAAAHLAGKIKAGGQGVWGAIPMPPQTLPEADVGIMARWLASGARN